jgi:hypothetical protein
LADPDFQGSAVLGFQNAGGFSCAGGLSKPAGFCIAGLDSFFRWSGSSCSGFSVVVLVGVVVVNVGAVGGVAVGGAGAGAGAGTGASAGASAANGAGSVSGASAAVEPGQHQPGKPPASSTGNSGVEEASKADGRACYPAGSSAMATQTFLSIHNMAIQESQPTEGIDWKKMIEMMIAIQLLKAMNENG